MTRNQNRTAISLGLIVIAFLMLWGARRWSPGAGTYPVQGIDISHHNGPVDWQRAASDGVQFVYIKATEGADLRDPQFATNWAGARAAGVRRGAYHFFTLCRLASDQATNFIATVPREADTLPVAIDLEFGGNCKERPSREVLLSELVRFIKMVEAHAGQPAMLYLTREFEDHYKVSEAIARPLWLRGLVLPPTYGARPWVMWQASNFRSVDGISGRVDWNVVRK